MIAEIRERSEALARVFDRIVRLRVIVNHQRRRGVFSARLNVAVPRGEMIVARGEHDHHTHDAPFAALRDAFDAARARGARDTSKRRNRAVTKSTEPRV